ncbi:MAG: tRNA (N(6)-L-threonylcarbamoyladenosine(37)-C(2))-methylthiotransferase MtaB, partial [Desulfobacteraceae bacterium]|nr:tRNA (N(6)-L-threonylcarbamoyladenosine(37)-C(2))-methylthiotransferase MtaB [Desulfobacteraceae bacterium]
MKTYYIKTLGCKVNRYESDGIATELEKNGFKKAKTIKDAQICIINTCTVTSKAGMQSRQAIRKIASSNPSAKVIVTGCHAQIEPE